MAEEDDDFGDFESGDFVPENGNDADENIPAKDQPLVQEQIVVTDPVMDNLDAPSNTNNDTDGNDDFGDFEAHTSDIPQQEEQIIVSNQDTTKESDPAAPRVVVEGGDAVVAGGEEDGDQNFEDFGSAPLNVEEEMGPGNGSSKETTANVQDLSAGDFGDFDGSSIPNEPPAPIEATTDAKDHRHDDFGPFDTDPASHVEGNDDKKHKSSDKESLNDSNDFGEFDTVPNVQQATTAVSPDLAGKDRDNDDDEDFGDFDSVPVSKEAVNISDDVDDDFGDFGAATASQNDDEAIIQEHEMQSPENAAVTQDSGGAKDDDEDDFGDFGDFAAAEPEQPPQPAMHVNDKGTGPAADNEDEDDFGDFGDFNDAEPVAASQTTQEPSIQQQQRLTIQSIHNDPLIHKARSTFSAIFGRHAISASSDNVALESETKSKEISIGNVLASVASKKRTSERHGKLESVQDDLVKYLRDESMVKTAPPRTILSSDTHNQYTHYSLPIAAGGGGSKSQQQSSLSSASSKRKGAGSSKRSSVPSFLPDVLNIRLDEKPVDMASPDLKPRDTVSVAHDNDSAGVPNLPIPGSGSSTNANDNSRASSEGAATATATGNANHPSNESARRPSQQVARFLKQIPDLSYMLSSKLSSSKEDGNM